jgi:hypothetical protein
MVNLYREAWVVVALKVMVNVATPPSGTEISEVLRISVKAADAVSGTLNKHKASKVVTALVWRRKTDVGEVWKEGFLFLEKTNNRTSEKNRATHDKIKSATVFIVLLLGLLLILKCLDLLF